MIQNLINNWDSIVAVIGTVGIACESALLALAALARALRLLAKSLLKLAAKTPSERDDAVLMSVIIGLEVAAEGLERAAAWIPRLRAGKGRTIDDEQKPKGMVLPLALIAAIFMVGCTPKAEHRARTALDVGARALVAIDVLGAEELRIKEQQCLDQPTIEDWRECMSPVFNLEASLRATKSTLYGAQSSVDAFGAEGWSEVAPCVVKSVESLLGASTAIGLRVPKELTQLLSLARAMGGSCEVDDDD